MFTFMDRHYHLPAPRSATLPVETLARVGRDVIAPDAAFVESVRRFGVVTPVVIVEDAGGLRVVDGRRRIAAARAAGVDALSAVIYPAGEGLPADLIILALNEQRSSNPLADFNAIRRLQERGATEQEISQATGMPPQRIRRRMKLASLLPELFDALSEGRLSVAVAEAAAGLSPAYQRALAATLAEKGRLTLADVRAVKVARREQALAAAPGLAGILSAPLPPAFQPTLNPEPSPPNPQAAFPDLAGVIDLFAPETLRRMRADLQESLWRAPARRDAVFGVLRAIDRALARADADRIQEAA